MFGRSSQRAHCATLRLVPSGSLTSVFLVGHESGMLMTCPNQRILPAFATVSMSGSPNPSARSWFILLLHPP
uniref:Uncharacterized protein n=1 Tax=Anopheles atroparvus TaxID=41427 RepID=A0AAG5DTH9_ANOAO